MSDRHATEQLALHATPCPYRPRCSRTERCLARALSSASRALSIHEPELRGHGHAGPRDRGGSRPVRPVRSGAGLVYRPVLPECRRQEPLLTLFGAEHSLGGIPGYNVTETTDENPERVALIQRLTWAYLRSAFYPEVPSWLAARSALTEGPNPLARCRPLLVQQVVVPASAGNGGSHDLSSAGSSAGRSMHHERSHREP